MNWLAFLMAQWSSTLVVLHVVHGKVEKGTPKTNQNKTKSCHSHLAGQANMVDVLQYTGQGYLVYSVPPTPMTSQCHAQMSMQVNIPCVMNLSLELNSVDT